MITRMPPYNIFEELPKIANQVREISEDLGMELDFAVEAMQATFDHAIQKASTGEANGWISVEDRLPDAETIVLAWDGRKIHTALRDVTSYKTPFWTDNVDSIKGVTHWQPLPPAPTSVPQAEREG